MGDLAGEAKLIKPLIEKPYIPTEVDKLPDPEQKKTLPLNKMTSVQIVGDTGKEDGKTEEKPTIYSTVIKKKSTTVSRPIQVVNTGIKVEIFPQATLPQGSYSIPVTIQSGHINDPTLTNYVVPVFRVNRENEALKMEREITGDIQAIIKGFQQGDKLKALLDAKERLVNEQNKLSGEIKEDKENINKMSELGKKVKGILDFYEHKLRNNHY